MPKPLSRARLAAAKAGLDKSPRKGLPPCILFIEIFTSLGAMSLIYDSKRSPIASGSWLGTNRILNLEWALEGITVLDPSPENPPHIPLISNAGRHHKLSKGV